VTERRAEELASPREAIFKLRKKKKVPKTTGSLHEGVIKKRVYLRRGGKDMT